VKLYHAEAGLHLSYTYKTIDNPILIFVMKLILIAVITAVLILVAAPTIAAASMDMTTDSCNSSPYHEKSSIPTCCLTADCLLSHCILTNAVDNEVLLASRFIPNKNVYIALSKTSVSTEASPNPKKPLQRDPSQELPSYPCTEYHCRNCLDSEEPHQV